MCELQETGEGGGELFHLETKFVKLPPKAKNSEKKFQFNYVFDSLISNKFQNECCKKFNL